MSISGYGQNENEFEQVSVVLNVPRIGNLEIETLIKKDQVYLPIGEVFDYLKIKNNVSENEETVGGFFIDPKAIFLINKNNNSIIYKDKTFKLTDDDIILTKTSLYLKSKFFGEIFGLDLLFNFRNLSIGLNTSIQLPAILEMQQQAMRNNIGKLNGEKKVDTTIKQKFSLLNVGMADWLVTVSQETAFKNNVRANLNLGGMVAGGEAEINLSYDNFLPFDSSQQYYRWRYVNNDNKALRQVTAGRIFTPSIATIYAPLNGVQFTNAPTTNRRVFGTYRISDKTEPGWTVELYINNVLVNYVKADASGFFNFDLPLLYGSSVIQLKFYGPWGEEKIREQTISIPFIFLPVRQLEYTVSAGVLNDDQNSRFLRTNLNYGLAKRVTVGGGVEYLSSVMDSKPYPYINTSLRLGNSMTVFLEHSPNIKSNIAVNYRLPSNLQIDVDYTLYNKGQTAIKFDYLEQKNIVISLPFRGKKFSAFTRLAYNQFTLPQYKYTNTEFFLTAMVAGINTNLSTYATFMQSNHAIIYSDIAVGYQLPIGLRFMPQAEYQYNTSTISMYKGELEKRLGRMGFLNLSYEKSIVNHYSSVTLGVRLNFSYAQTSFSVRKSNEGTEIIQAARGNLVYNREARFIGFNNQTNVGSGGVIVLPFLDLNCNGRRDIGEPKAIGLNLRSNGGMIKQNRKDTTISITGLEAFTNYYVEIDNYNFENIAWQIKKKIFCVQIEPNRLKVVEVAVAIVGEVSGTVYFQDDKGSNGLGRIIVNIYNKDSVFIQRIITEGDGFFDYIGLAPGAYYATVDTGQMGKLQMASSPALPFMITSNKDGDVISSLKFTLRSTKKAQTEGKENGP